MFTPRAVPTCAAKIRRAAGLIAMFAVLIICTVVRAQQRPAPPKGPGLGVPATPAEIASADISIPPDGAGLPEGSGTPAQGGQVYAAKCLACHGPEGAGGINDRLVGGHGTMKTTAPVKTVGSYWPYATTVFDYIRRAMPYPEPHSLTNAEAYALTAYLLHLNGVIAADAVMDAKTLPKVQMPNRGNFVLALPPAKKK
jgi:S-disulfanyl-L-cysteine oxidoreductase SoxD